MLRLLKAMAVACVLAAAGCISAPPPPAPPPPPPVSIYSNGLGGGWNDWSWSEVTLGVAYGGHLRPIQVNADGWGGLYLQRAAVDTTGYSKLVIWLNGGETGGQLVRIVAVQGGRPIELASPFRINLVAGEWRRYEIPLTAFSADNRVLDGFWVQNDVNEPIPVFYVNNISLE